MRNAVTLITGVASRILNVSQQAYMHYVTQVPNVTLWYGSSMLVAFVVSILRWSGLAADDDAVVIQRYPFTCLIGDKSEDLAGQSEGPVCLECREFGCRRSPGFLLTNTLSSLAPMQNKAFIKKTQQISGPSSNDLWLDITGVAIYNCLVSVEYKLQGPWLGDVLEETDF
ncbi:hypothetical protein TNCV_4172731 [Trichonephila clavipes]|nr:hypothetical protein TNCV_4172731 [Trichonephila clavipes]